MSGETAKNCQALSGTRVGRLSGICVDMRMILFNGKGLEQTGLVWRSGILG